MKVRTQENRLPLPKTRRVNSSALVLLQVYALTLMAIPSDTVIKSIGGAGYVSSLVAMGLFAAWVASTFLGFHNPLGHRHPVRASIAALWLVSLVSYALMSLTERSSAELLGSQRWFMQIAGITGVAVVAAEFLPTLADVHRVMRALVWGGAFCGSVAGLQFFLSIDVSRYLRMIPGFSINGDSVGISARAALNRVSGTAIHPIELGVVMGMLLPLAIYLALYDDPARRPWKRWLPVGLIAVAIPASVSRSAIIAAAFALGIFVLALPARHRVVAIATAPFAVLGIFLTVPGFIGTLAKFFTAGSSDTSITHRTNNYAFVSQMVSHAPWFGQGGGTYMPSGMVNSVHVLDNQYLHTAIELGVVGVCVLAYYFLLPMATGIVALRRSLDPGMRALCGALAGAAAAAAVCSLTFDSMSFPMFSGMFALVVGLTGACWLIGSDRARASAEAQSGPPADTIAAQGGW